MAAYGKGISAVAEVRVTSARNKSCGQKTDVEIIK